MPNLVGFLMGVHLNQQLEVLSISRVHYMPTLLFDKGHDGDGVALYVLDLVYV